MIAFRDAIPESTPSELRSFFVILTLQGYATINIFKNFKAQLKGNDFESNNDFLIEIENRFTAENRDMSQYGLPKPQVYLIINIYFLRIILITSLLFFLLI
jgi:hypothetical protein